jgi:hypothetical protein
MNGTAGLRLMSRGTRYGLVRSAVHLLHRVGVMVLALGPAPVRSADQHLSHPSSSPRRSVPHTAGVAILIFSAFDGGLPPQLLR